MITKKFEIKPDGGHVLGGQAQYAVDPATGKIHYSVAAAIAFWGTHQLNPSGDYLVAPSLLESARVKAGQTLVFGVVKITVVDIQGKVAHAKITIDGYGQGVAVLSLAQPTIEIISVDAVFNYMLCSGKLEVVSV